MLCSSEPPKSSHKRSGSRMKKEKPSIRPLASNTRLLFSIPIQTPGSCSHPARNTRLLFSIQPQTPGSCSNNRDGGSSSLAAIRSVALSSCSPSSQKHRAHVLHPGRNTRLLFYIQIETPDSCSQSR